MLVSQYIYTACGKERTGAFSVFSKSKDITDTESAEIREVMMYKAPSGLPFEPSEQEIEELYPKKFGYFFLSSGRVCLAHVCYVGRVYSDSDGRSGNYIIHAVVFNKTNELSPYSFIEHTLFKRFLTRKEWHDDPIPDELPQIDIPESGGMLSASEINAFFNDDRKGKLKLLIEAIINSSNENPVCLFDEPKNLKFWFKALSICLPKTMQNAISFCTHFTNSIMPGNLSSRIQMRVNQPDSYQFNYNQEVQKGRYAFDFVRNIIPKSLQPDKYAESIVALFSSGLFEAVKFVDDINKVMSTYSVGINEASDLIKICKADYSSFTNTDSLFSTILIADRIGYETHMIADNLWTRMPNINFTVQQNLSIYAFIYKNLTDTGTRIQIIKAIMDNTEQFGICSDEAKIFSDDLNSKASFVFSNYFEYLKEEGLINYITRNLKSFSKLFVAFEFLINLQVVKDLLKAHKYHGSDETLAIKSIMELAFQSQSISEVNLLVHSANSHIRDIGTDLLLEIIQEAINSGTVIDNAKFTLDILGLLRSKTEFAFKYLLFLIKTISGKSEFIKEYIKAQISDPSFYNRFESEFKHDQLINDFCRKKEAFRFANQPLTFQSLKDYFDKFYVVGADTGLFVKRLGEYLRTIQSEKIINECANMLDKMRFPMNVDRNLLPPVYCVILETIFSTRYNYIHDLCEKREWVEKIYELYSIVTNAGAVLKQETRELVIVTLCGRNLLKRDFCDPRQAMAFFNNTQGEMSNLSNNINLVDNPVNVDLFIDYYFQPVVNLMILGATNSKQLDYDGILERVFGGVIEKGNLEKITDSIMHGIKKSKISTIDFVLYLFKKRLLISQRKFDKKLGGIVESYFEKISSGERKRLFAELLKFAEPREVSQFEQFFDSFNKEHKSSIFSFFRKND